MFTVVLWAVGEASSRHSPKSMEAANMTTVVTTVTSRLSRTLQKCIERKSVSYFMIFLFQNTT